MPSTREIRRRIRSVKNISKVTKAMETVAAAKMRKAQQQVLMTRPYAEKSREVLAYLARLRASAAPEQPLLQQRPINKVALLLITGDRGLAGAYNANVIREAMNRVDELEEEGKQVSVVTVGAKGRDFMLRHGPPLHAVFTGLSDRPSANDVAPIAQVLIDAFVNEDFDAVYIVATKFVNTMRQEPDVSQLLPIRPAAPEHPMAADYIFEPSPQAILGEVLRGLTELQILQAVYEAMASEQSARMVAMRNATESANELIGELTLSYNKARQEAITKELLDIVGGSSALQQAA
ncbi:MAG: ATP synthase gamma chain [Chloroflexi bacterium ADurb.Bin325]|nr:MAG: ATP synthase gamma chain [Chloroflexi bacterium ADurb.Bin325]